MISRRARRREVRESSDVLRDVTRLLHHCHVGWYRLRRRLRRRRPPRRRVVVGFDDDDARPVEESTGLHVPAVRAASAPSETVVQGDARIMGEGFERRAVEWLVQGRVVVGGGGGHGFSVVGRVGPSLFLFCCRRRWDLCDSDYYYFQIINISFPNIAQ